ncbi:hypothetical protein RJ641_005589 [Dillenia turbinata]|uniref:Phosphoribosylformylglycinamidine synthase n=1 Tax=Dillenia turbinata TaxID=194707 RepID=A0AAN8Z7E8_9MAGN
MSAAFYALVLNHGTLQCLIFLVEPSLCNSSMGLFLLVMYSTLQKGGQLLYDSISLFLDQFQEFYNRPDTCSLGVCDGCQLMALLGWVPGPQVGGVHGVGRDPSQPCFVHNESGCFECRFTSVTIKDSLAIMFKRMEGSTLGVWAAHGEGRAYFPDNSVKDSVLNSNLAPLRYCDDDGKPTKVYPFNLNGSPQGVAAHCSPDGRHLAMMPHPECCFLLWQFPWYPKH